MYMKADLITDDFSRVVESDGHGLLLTSQYGGTADSDIRVGEVGV